MRLDNFKKIMIGYNIFVNYSILYAWICVNSRGRNLDSHRMNEWMEWVHIYFV